MSHPILYECVGHVATLTLNSPAHHNSLGVEALTALRMHLEQLAVNRDVRVLVVTGAGHKTFCAGASLTDLAAGKMDGATFQAVTDLLAKLNIPTLCALNGSVFGGGAELALSCDFRVGVTGMKLRVPAAAIGLCYPISGIQRFVQRLGVPNAKRILMAAETFSAEQLLAMDFVDTVVPHDNLAAVVRQRADHLAGLAPMAVSAMKQIIRDAGHIAVDEARAGALVSSCEQSDDFREGLTAVREKRAPVFTGR